MSNDISWNASRGQVNCHGSSYQKHYIPLESNPDLFTKLIHKLGVPPSLAFVDVLSIDDPDLLAFIPLPAFVFILVFPTSNTYEDEIAREDTNKEDYSRRGEKEDVMWFKQTINNSCGLYGILHAVSNGEGRNFIRESKSLPLIYLYIQIFYLAFELGSSIEKRDSNSHKAEPNSSLANLSTSCLLLGPDDRALEELEVANAEVTMQRDSSVPNNAEDEVDFHYLRFLKSHNNDHLYEIDGDRKGAIDRGPSLTPDEHILAEGGLSLINEFIQREKSGDPNFSTKKIMV